MSMHNNGGHKHDDEMQLGSHGPDEVDASAGFEQSDVRVTGIVVFLAALGIFVVVTAVLCYGIGKVINAHMDKEDGPNARWTTTADIRQLGNLANNPALQNKVAQLAQQFPSPRLQLDDVAHEFAPRLAWVGDDEGQQRTHYDVHCDHHHDHMSDIGQDPPRPGIPTQIQRAEYERQRASAPAQMQSQRLESKFHGRIFHKSAAN